LSNGQGVPTMWEVIAIVIIFAAIGWLIAALYDSHRHV
jgi:hypothetical protein